MPRDEHVWPAGKGAGAVAAGSFSQSIPRTPSPEGTLSPSRQRQLRAVAEELRGRRQAAFLGRRTGGARGDQPGVLGAGSIDPSAALPSAAPFVSRHGSGPCSGQPAFAGR